MRTTDIKTAVVKAQKIGGYITRAAWKEYMYVKVTDLPECCICYAKDEGPCPRWQPKAEDMMAEDWEVVQHVGKNYSHCEQDE